MSFTAKPDDDFFQRLGVYPYLKSALVLALILVVPFFVSYKSEAGEPYPAVLLPGGASLMDTDEHTFAYTAIKLFGIDSSSGREQRLDVAKTIAPLPTTHLIALARTSFRLDTLPVYGWRRFSYGTSRYALGREQRREVWDWLGHNLKKQGCLADSVIIAQSLVVIDTESQIKSSENLLKEVRLGKN